MSSPPSRPYIKVYINELRDLVKNAGLRRAWIGELLLLALYMDEDGVCWPGKKESAEAVGMKSPHGARRIHHILKELGVLDWDFDHDKRSPRFRIPQDVFFFGRDSYRDHNCDPRGVYNSDPRGDHNMIPRGVHNSDPEQESSRTRTTTNENQSKQHLPSGREAAQHGDTTVSLEPATGADPEQQQQIEQQLIAAGVKPYEAKLISKQFYPTTVEAALRAASSNPYIMNQGAWIRRTIELRAGRPLVYPNSSSQVRERADQADRRGGEKYVQDSYFTRERKP